MNKFESDANSQSNKLQKALPWLAGAGFALSHIAMSSNCTVPKEGRCSTCGSCVVALGAIVAWAVLKNKSPVKSPYVAVDTVEKV